MILKLIIYLISALLVMQISFAQTEQQIQRKAKGRVTNPDEMVSFKADVPFSKAVQLLGELSKKLDGKIIIDKGSLEAKDKSIGINIEPMYWKDALELILRSNQLWYNDYPEYMEIVTLDEIGKPSAGGAGQGDAKSAGGAKLDSKAVEDQIAVKIDSSELFAKRKEVAVSAIVFDLNQTQLAEIGMGISFVRGSGVNLQVMITGATKVTKSAFYASASPRGANMPVDIDAAISMFESEQLGRVIARPKVIVPSGESNKIQIGQDFSVLEKDFSGNTVQKFYPTGTILTVSPTVYKIGETEFVNLKYRVEKSTFEATTVTTVINKTDVGTGSLTLLNGEEGYVGGLYSMETVTVREGVPLLKDLPWWVFGLRYLFGYDQKKEVKRELIVILKVEILPSIEERAMMPYKKDIIKDAQKEMQQDYQKRIAK